MVLRETNRKQAVVYNRDDRMSPLVVFLNELEFNREQLQVEEKTINMQELVTS